MPRRTILFFIVGGFASYLIAASAVHPGAVTAAALRIAPATWAAVLALSLLNYALRFVRWQVYLRGLGHRLPPGRHLLIYIAGFALTPTPAKAGEAMRGVYLKPLGVGYARCLATVYAERVLDLLAVSLLTVLIWPMAHAPKNEWLGWLAGAGLAIAVALIAIQQRAVLDRVEQWARRLPRRLRRFGEGLVRFQRDIHLLYGASLLALGTALGLAAWAAEGIGFYLIAERLDIGVGALAAVGIYAVSMLAGALSFLPGGLGSAEAAMVSLLVVSGAPLPAALATTVLARLATLWFAVALGICAWLAVEMRPLRPAFDETVVK